MGKFEKKPKNTSPGKRRPLRNDEDYDGYDLDGLRQMHEGRGFYDDAQGRTVMSSSARTRWDAERTQDSYAPSPSMRGAASGTRVPEEELFGYDQPAPQGRTVREKAPRRRRRRKKHRLLRFLLWLLSCLLGLILLVGLGSALFSKMPETDQPIGARKPGCCTILLCGTDQEGLRTDTMLLLYLDRKQGQSRLLSLPRDTMVNRDSSVPKLNGAYGANGADEKGMNALMGYVKDLVGYRPDAYVLLDLNCFAELVDAMGGVTFDVPMDMYYDDPTQDLFIDLKAGTQKLNGQQAMWLVRYRSGYAMADLERAAVQRDFLKAAISQWKSVKKLPMLPRTAKLLIENTQTDLSYRNLCWLAITLAGNGSGSFESDTLPGEPAWVDGGAYYVEDREAAAELINEKYNPYEVEIRAEDLHPYGK